MTRRRVVLLVAGTVVLAGIAAGVVLLLKKRAQEPATQPYSTGFIARNWAYHLRPIKRGEPDAGMKAEEVWRDLFRGMAKDPATRDLLKRLHGNLPVEFVVVDAKVAVDDAVMMAPPSEGFAFAMRVGDLSTYKKKDGSRRDPVPGDRL